MPRILGFLLAVAAAVFMASCTSDKPEDPNSVSNIPWNRPEKWEGQGPMGGMMPGTQ